MHRDRLGEAVRERGLEGDLLLNEPLSRHTSYRIGGAADFYLIVEKEEQLCRWVGLARELQTPYLIMGGGTNLLVADKGFRGLVIENRCRDFVLDEASYKVRAEAGVPLAFLARTTANHGSAGLEWAVGIPGTVGGAMVNNAGAYGGAVADVVRGVRILGREGQIRELALEEVKFGYRTSRFRQQNSPREAILSVKFSLSPESTEVLTRRMAEYQALRRAEHPRKPSAGSVFKNPPGLSAGKLIEQAGLKGKRVGNAQISPGHGNYIVNLGSATAKDVMDLIKLVREGIWQRFKVELELEIETVGEWGQAEII